MTISGDTIVHTLSGDTFIIDLVGKAEPTYIFSWDGTHIVPGRILIESTKYRVPVRLTLDSSEELLVTDDSTTYLFEGGRILIQDLQPQSSLLPIYLKTDGDGYPIFREPRGWNRQALTDRDKYAWRKVARMVGDYNLSRRMGPNDRISMVDGNKRNCVPSNVEIKHCIPKQRTWTNKMVAPLADAHDLMEAAKNKKKPKKRGRKPLKKKNHKLMKIEFDISREMFLIRGINTANFGTSGIFIDVDIME